MSFVIVPDSVSQAINAEIDRFMIDRPDLRHLREDMFNDLLEVFDRTGQIAKLAPGDMEDGMDDSIIGSLP